MCEVVKSNFEKLLPEILSNIDKASFVAIDGEFTGLNLNTENKGSLFDMPEDRYNQLRQSSSAFLLSQIGLSIFVSKENENEYEAFTYNFYLFPATQNITDVIFQCQASSLEFLCQYKFDFNKFIYEGIPYINIDRLEKLKAEIKNKGLLNVGEFNEQSLEMYCSSVTEWAVQAKEHETMNITIPLYLSPYIVQAALRQQLPNVWTRTNNNDFSILIEKVSETTRQQYENTHCSLEEEAINSILGFSKVYQYLIKCKKPIIGHNMFSDLMMMFSHFHHIPPNSLSKFKTEISKLFPLIFDTKHILFQIRNKLKDSEEFDLNNIKIVEGQNLHEVYENLCSHKGKYSVLYQPSIIHASGFDRYHNSDSPHEAGFDAYIAGYVFLRLAHLYANKDLDCYGMRPLTDTEHINAMKCFAGFINIIRAGVNFINLNGDEPNRQRPEWLIVTPINKGSPLNIIKITSEMARYGTIDFRVKNKFQVLIAVGNFRSAKDILRSFHGHPEYRVTKYSVLRHSPVITPLLWTGMVVTGGLGIWLMVASCLKSHT